MCELLIFTAKLRLWKVRRPRVFESFENKLMETSYPRKINFDNSSENLRIFSDCNYLFNFRFKSNTKVFG